MSATVPTTAEFNALAAKVTALTTQQTAITADLAASAVRVGSLEARVTALETPVIVLPPPPPPPPPPSTGALFASDWVTGTPKDNWDLYDEWNGGTGIQLMSVAPGIAPGGGNALKVLQRGELAAAVRKNAIVPQGTDFYVRFYFRNDDTSSSGDHCAAGDVYEYANLTYLRKSSGPNDWQHIISVYGCGFVYPVGHWHLRNRLARQAWYRMEFFIHFTSPTAIQVHPRIYDVTGGLLYQDADYQQADFGGSGNWNGSQTWTLASYYAAGRDFCVHPEFLTALSIGNNGQAGAVDTGLPWYFAGVEVRTDRWPGA